MLGGFHDIPVYMSKFVALQLSAMLGGFHDIPVSTSTRLILHAIWCIEAQLMIRDPCYEHILILREILLLHRIMGWNMGISSFVVAYNYGLKSGISSSTPHAS
jgi:hypothetical protein